MHGVFSVPRFRIGDRVQVVGDIARFYACPVGIIVQGESDTASVLNQYTVRLALAYFHVATSLQHPVALVGSIAKQISFIIIIVAIAQWFKTVVRRDPPSDSEDANT